MGMDFLVVVVSSSIKLQKTVLGYMSLEGARGGGARGVMVIVAGNGHGDTSSNPGRDWLHFT